MEKVLSVVSLTKTFTVRKNAFSANDVISAVNHVTFDLHKREVLGVVGESGCGKSTLARLLIQSIRPDSGKILLNHEPLNFNAPAREIRKKCKKIQMVYQNPYTSLNPKMSVTDNITFGPIANGVPRREAEQKALDYLAAVGMKGSYAHLYPHNLSGGQRQRVAIARALAMEPEIILADEPVSALDKSVQAQVLNLFQELKERFSLSIVFISHDLSVVEYMSDTILVMYLGEVVEQGAASEVYAHPQHPYTRELLAAIPDIGEGLRREPDETPAGLIDLPSPINPPGGCRFHPRCPYCMELCKKAEPGPVAVGEQHTVYCHRRLEA